MTTVEVIPLPPGPVLSEVFDQCWQRMLLDNGIPPQMFQAAFLQSPATPDPLRELAEKYHRDTEAYDRTVCHGPLGHAGCIQPANAREALAISAYAMRYKTEMLIEAKKLGYTAQQVRDAIAAATPRNRKGAQT